MTEKNIIAEHFHMGVESLEVKLISLEIFLTYENFRHQVTWGTIASFYSSSVVGVSSKQKFLLIIVDVEVYRCKMQLMSISHHQEVTKLFQMHYMLRMTGLYRLSMHINLSQLCSCFCRLRKTYTLVIINRLHIAIKQL